jgi:hypothetical protein
LREGVNPANRKTRRNSNLDNNELCMLVDLVALIIIPHTNLSMPHPDPLPREREYSPSPWGEGAGG